MGQSSDQVNIMVLHPICHLKMRSRFSTFWNTFFFFKKKREVLIIHQTAKWYTYFSTLCFVNLIRFPFLYAHRKQQRYVKVAYIHYYSVFSTREASWYSLIFKGLLLTFSYFQQLFQMHNSTHTKKHIRRQPAPPVQVFASTL